MQSVWHTVFHTKANQIKTLEVIEESVILSNNDFFLNWPGNHNAVEAINTLKGKILGVLPRCTIKDCKLQCRE